MNNKEILGQLGLNNKEVDIYLATLEQGLAPATTIAKTAGIQRTHFYDLAEKLLRLGLLKQVIKDRRRCFAALQPDKLISIYERRLELLKKAIPELESLHSSSGQKPRIYYYEGRDGIEQINRDTLLHKGEIVGFTTPRFLTKHDEELSRLYIKKRINLKNKVRVIGEVSPEIQSLRQRDKQELRETRMLPKDYFHSNIEIGIYGNKVFVIDYKQEFGFIVESEEISRTMKMIFELIWGSGKIVG